MPGLDAALVASLDKDTAFARVLADVETDFIFAPQYKILYEFMKDEIWVEITSALRSGTYNPSSLITAEIPKPSGLTRPGSILFPIDEDPFRRRGTELSYIAGLVDGLQLDWW